MNNENDNMPVPSTVPATSVNQTNQQFGINSQIQSVQSQQAASPVVEILQPKPIVASTQPVVQAPMPVTSISTQASTEPVTNPTAVQQPQMDANAMVNENLKKVEIKDYTPPSKFKVAVLLVFFALLIAFIIFLPEISSMVRIYMSGVNNQPSKVEVITTGRLICNMKTNTTDLDKEYEFTFSFTDSKLIKTKYVSSTRGDSTTENSLDVLAEKCSNLKESTALLEGVSIKCNYADGNLLETQTFDLETVNIEELNAAFTEAGGIMPTYKLNQDIDEIERNMKASNYTCERQK